MPQATTTARWSYRRSTDTPNTFGCFFTNQKGCRLPVAITIRRVQDIYEARVTAPHGQGPFQWQTSVPMERGELVRALVAIGCHTTDIGDALAEADREGQITQF
jgi:hypothetical protein